MNYILIVFKSRSETLNFASLLKGQKIPATVVNTPREVSRACGISIKCFSEYTAKILELIRFRRYNSYAGMYKVTEFGIRKEIERID